MTRNVLAVGLLCAACCAAGYVRGFGVAETRGRALLAEPVSYTHLTLPTILRV